MVISGKYNKKITKTKAKVKVLKNQSGISTSDLVTPLVAEVSVEVHPGTQAECSRVGVPVLPPQPVRGVRKLVPGHNSGHSMDRHVSDV